MHRLYYKIIKWMIIIISVITFIVIVKAIWVIYATNEHGSFDGEKKEIIRRANYLTSRVVTSPQELLAEMPSAIGTQFKEYHLQCGCRK